MGKKGNVVCIFAALNKTSCGTVSPLTSVVLLWTSESDTHWSFGQPILMAAHENTTAKFSLIS